MYQFYSMGVVMNVTTPFLLILTSMLFLLQGQALALDIPQKYRGGVVIATEDNMPPMAFVGPNGESKGFIVDLWKKWSAETGVPVSFRLGPWGEGLDSIRNGSSDIHAGLFITPERLEFMEFGNILFPSNVSLFSKKGSSIIGFDDLAGHSVGVLGRGATDEMLKRDHPNLIRKRYDTSRDTVMGVLRGEVDVVISDSFAIRYILGEQGRLDEYEERAIIYKDAYRPGVKKGNKELLNLVNEGMGMIDEAERENILSVWYVADSSVSTSLKVGLGLAVASLLLGLGVLMFGGRGKRS